MANAQKYNFLHASCNVGGVSYSFSDFDSDEKVVSFVKEWPHLAVLFTNADDLGNAANGGAGVAPAKTAGKRADSPE